jgi:hypothetical protein
LAYITKTDEDVINEERQQVMDACCRFELHNIIGRDGVMACRSIEEI